MTEATLNVIEDRADAGSIQLSALTGLRNLAARG